MPTADGNHQDNAVIAKGHVTFCCSDAVLRQALQSRRSGQRLFSTPHLMAGKAFAPTDYTARDPRRLTKSCLMRQISEWRKLAEQRAASSSLDLATALASALARQLNDIIHKAGYPGLAIAFFADLTPNETQVSQFVFGPKRRILRTRRLRPFV